MLRLLVGAFFLYAGASRNHDRHYFDTYPYEFIFSYINTILLIGAGTYLLHSAYRLLKAKGGTIWQFFIFGPLIFTLATLVEAGRVDFDLILILLVGGGAYFLYSAYRSFTGKGLTIWQLIIRTALGIALVTYWIASEFKIGKYYVMNCNEREFAVDLDIDPYISVFEVLSDYGDRKWEEILNDEKTKVSITEADASVKLVFNTSTKKTAKLQRSIAIFELGTIWSLESGKVTMVHEAWDGDWVEVGRETIDCKPGRY